MTRVQRTVGQRRMIQRAIEAGLLELCDVCDMAGLMSAYTILELDLALRGVVTLDPNPTHLCVPPPPVNRHNPMDAINREVVESWS